MKRMIMVVALVVVAFATPPAIAAASGNVLFRGAAQPKAELLRPKALAVDAAGRPLFSAAPAYLFAQAANPSRRVQEWNPALQLVRVSAGTDSPLWLRCTDLKPMTIACSTMRIRADSNGSIEIGQPVGRQRSFERPPAVFETGAVPACPGDPRCPRSKS